MSFLLISVFPRIMELVLWVQIRSWLSFVLDYILDLQPFAFLFSFTSPGKLIFFNVFDPNNLSVQISILTVGVFEKSLLTGLLSVFRYSTIYTWPCNACTLHHIHFFNSNHFNSNHSNHFQFESLFQIRFNNVACY